MTWKWILFSDWYIHDIFVGTHADYTYGNTSSKGIVSWDDQTPSTSCLLTYIIVILMHNWTQCYLVLSHGCLSFVCPLISFFIWSTSLLDMQWPNMFNRATVWEDQVRLFTVTPKAVQVYVLQFLAILDSQHTIHNGQLIELAMPYICISYVEVHQ